MDFEMKIWDLPKTKKEAIEFFQDKGLLLTTEHCINGQNMTLYSYEKEHFWKCNNRPCLQKVNLRINAWFDDNRIQ